MQQERYFQWNMNRCLSLLSPFYWGYSQLELSSSSLSQGSIYVKCAEGIFKEYGYFSVQNQYLEIDYKSTDTQQYTIYIIKQHDRDSISLSINAPTSGDGLPICKFSEFNGECRLDETYLPPCVQISASTKILTEIDLTIRSIAQRTEHQDLLHKLTYIRQNPSLHPSELHKIIYLNTTEAQQTYEHNNIYENIIKQLYNIRKRLNEQRKPNFVYFNKSGMYWTAEIDTTPPSKFIDLYIKTNKPYQSINFKLSTATEIDRIVKFSFRGMPPKSTTHPEPQLSCFRFEKPTCPDNHSSLCSLALHINDDILAERPWLCICK